MAPAKWTAVATLPPTRRTPVQRRSRERVQRILQAAEELVVGSGVHALSTRAVAERAQIPVPTLYQYFADREAIIRALIERHVASMEARIAEALAALESYSVRSVVEATIAAYRADYRRAPSYVVLWFQGRQSADIARFIRERDEQLADAFHRFGIAIGLLKPDTDPLVIRLCFEVADRFLEAAYRYKLAGEDRVVREGIEMIVAHLERHATPAGVAGIDAASVGARWGDPVAPQGDPVAPQGEPVAPQGDPIAPQGDPIASQGGPVAPHWGDSAAPHRRNPVAAHGEDSLAAHWGEPPRARSGDPLAAHPWQIAPAHHWGDR